MKAWLIWFISGLFYLYEFTHRVAPSVMIPELQQAFLVSQAALGGLSGYYYYAYAAAQIPSGLMVDRFQTRYLLSISALMTALGSLVFAMTTDLMLANLSRAFIGLGSAFSFVGCLKLASAWFPARRFALIVGLTNFMGVCGAILGGNPLAQGVDAFGWRMTMYGSAAIGLILTIALWFMIKDNPPTQTNAATENANSNWTTAKKLQALVNCRQLWVVALFGSFMVVPIATYSELWGVSYIQTQHGLARPQAAFIATLTFVGIAIGGPVIGWISDRTRNRKTPLIIGCLGALITISLIIYGPKLSLFLSAFLHTLFGFFTSSMLLCFSLNTERVPVQMKGTVIGFTNTIVMGISALAQPITGKLLDISQNNYPTAFGLMVVSHVLALMASLLIKDTHCVAHSQVGKQ